MGLIDLLILAIVAAGLAAACVASVRVIRERQEFVRTLAQLAFVWLVPFIGPLVTMQLLRREPELHRSQETDDPGQVGEQINQRSAYRPTRHDEAGDHAEVDPE
jgi:hypothetical protein